MNSQIFPRSDLGVSFCHINAVFRAVGERTQKETFLPALTRTSGPIITKYWPTLLGALAGAATFTIGLQFEADESERWLLASRYTARVGFFFLILTYSASSLVRLWPVDLTRSLMRSRKWWGLGFGER